MSLVVTRDLNMSFGGDVVLKSADINIEAGSIVGLLGRNGSGKSTLLKLLAGILSPTRGTVNIAGMAAGVGPRAMTYYSADADYFYANMTVHQQLKFIAGFYSSWDWDKCFSMLEQQNIPAEKKIALLSEGQKAKLKLIICFSWEAGLVLLDEPFKGIDLPSKQVILDTIINEYRYEQQTIILSTHHINETERILDQVLILKDGNLVYAGELDALRQEKQASLAQIFVEMTA